MAERNQVQEAFDAFGKTAGMVKQSGSWYSSNGEVTTVLNLQKSDYSRNYYINVAFWLKALGNQKFPKEHQCHIRVRLDALIPDQAEEIRVLLDLQRDVDMDRSARLLSLLKSRMLPLFHQSSSLDGLRKWWREGVLANAFINGPARALLEVA